MNRELFRIPKEFISRYSILGEDLPKYRTEFMRDRDRVMYCTAFKRLAGKTQIYTIGSDDHRKNRLTHSLEVAQIARTISRALGLNEELTEAIALGHDLGHTPFGHAGERMLHTIMCPKSDVVKDSPFFGKEADTLKRELERESASIPEVISYETMFGFKHNIQSVRVAVVLEDSYRGGKGENIGLNLTNYTLWGMMNHSKRLYEEREIYPNFQNQFAELFDTSKQGIGQHIANILNERELDANSVVKKSFTTVVDGKNYEVTMVSGMRCRGNRQR